MFTRSVSPEDAPDKATYVEIEYEKGDPVAVNGDSQSPASILASLNKVGLYHLHAWIWTDVALEKNGCS